MFSDRKRTLSIELNYILIDFKSSDDRLRIIVIRITKYFLNLLNCGLEIPMEQIG